MLEANEALLEQHGLCVVPRLTGELPQLHLCCFTPRYGLSFSDPDVQLAANLALFDGPSAPERDQELALTAMCGPSCPTWSGRESAFRLCPIAPG